ncbi:MAG: potassium transporter [Deltaproteobacteria bacterium]|nr:potassium transporter [Deltaproteobacteria bacterium]HCH63280.1 potassium transporter [Deltaproteobacteria bacterium]
MHRVIARPVGLVLLVIAATLTITILVELAFNIVNLDGGPPLRDVAPLLATVPVATALGLLCLWWGRTIPSTTTMDRRDASVAVVAIWTLLGLVGAIPLMIGAGTSFVDAFFESVSGFTTTGATIYGDIEGTLSPPLILWRAVMHWLGGMGIVVLFVAIFPNLGVSGKHLFRSEVPGVTAEGLRPRITDTSLVLWQLYTGLTVLAVGLLWWLGMGPHDAIVHGLGTLSTGGFSSRDASIAAFANPAIEWVLAILMIIAGINFGLFYAVVRTGRLDALWKSTELRFYLGIVAVCTALLTVILADQHHGQWLESFRYAFFRVATTLTSTGFGIDDHREYPPLAMGILLFMMVIGGCAGSTAGGLKVARVMILVKSVAAQIRRSVRPAVISVVRIDRRPVSASVVVDVMSFFVLYIGLLGAFSLVVVQTDGVPVPTALGAVLSCLSNMGPAPFYLEVDNFSGWSSGAKLVFSAAMVMGRLEFFTVLAVFLPEVWRR